MCIDSFGARAKRAGSISLLSTTGMCGKGGGGGGGAYSPVINLQADTDGCALLTARPGYQGRFLGYWI